NSYTTTNPPHTPTSDGIRVNHLPISRRTGERTTPRCNLGRSDSESCRRQRRRDQTSPLLGELHARLERRRALQWLLDLRVRWPRCRLRAGTRRRRAPSGVRERRHHAMVGKPPTPQPRPHRRRAACQLRGTRMSTSSARVPCTIVTGFLGAGKTTLIRHVLAHTNGRRLAVIVNEFGDVGIDGEILKGCGDEACPQENIVELA